MSQAGKRRLKIDLDELNQAFEYNDFEMRYYLDKQMGDVLRVTDETDRIVEEVSGALGEDASPAQIRDYLAGRDDVPDWQVDEVFAAHWVEEGYGDTVVEVPQIETREAHQDMADFLDTVSQPGLRERLVDAIHGRGEFSRFRRALDRDPDERERWFAFKEERMRRRVLEWLDGEGIEPGED